MTSPQLGALGPKTSIIQNVKYVDSETEYTTEVQGEVLQIHCNEGTHNHGSSKVKLIDRIDYNWEFKYHYGHLVAAHINGRVIAYGMKGKDGGMLRVANQDTNQRALIKNLKEDIKDVSFAYSRDDIILGCVDSEGNILIYEIEDTPHSISYTLLLHVYHGDPLTTSKVNYRLIWCPYLPGCDDWEDCSDDPEKMFVVLNGTKAEVYNVAMLTKKCGKGGPIDPDESFEGYIEINHTAELVDASFSSDGTAIAIACSDGYVKFFQLYMFDREKHKCLHEWQPHDGKPLSSIIFIDNILDYSAECWKFAITGANNNSEIKLWSCESWTCLQTIIFKPNPNNLISSLYLNMALDYRGQFLVVSDINNRVLYFMQLQRNDEAQLVCVVLLAQFLLPAPFLCFHVLDANLLKIPFSFNNSNEDLYDNEDEFDEDSVVDVISLKMLVIQPKKFQECNIVFKPKALMNKGVSVTLSDDPMMNEKNDEKEKILKLDDLQSSVTLLIQQQTSSKLTLMTPDDFAPPGKESRSNSLRNSITNESCLNQSVEKIEEIEADFEKPQKENFASAGSSPSREVEEILSLNNSSSNYGTQEYFKNLASLQDEQEQPQKDYPCTEKSNIFPDSVSWPKIPVVKDGDIIKAENEANELMKLDLQTVVFRIDSLETIIREQNILMQQLHQDVKVLNQAVSRTGDEKLEFVKEMECAMSKQHLQLAKMFENLVTMQKKKDREFQEQFTATVGQMVTKSLVEKMQQVIHHQMEHVVLPAVRGLVESYLHKLDGQYSQKISNIDGIVRDNLAKVLNSKSLTDSLSSSVVSLVAPSLEKCYRDIVASSLIPSWERVCGQMFQQINETFTRGTKEYTASVENYMDRQRRVQEKGKDLIVQMQNVSDSMKSNADKLTSTLSSEIHKQFNIVFKSMHDKMMQSMKEVINEQIKQGFKSHATVIEDSVINAVRSRAVTPSPLVDNHITTLNRIQQSLLHQNYNEAFQIALSAENLSYVIFVCEKVDINKIFGEECLLQQSCILALIQQLSMELHKSTDLKLSFIRGAFLALSPDQQYVPKVLKDLLKQLNLYMQMNPPKKHLTDAKLLKMAVENMISK